MMLQLSFRTDPILISYMENESFETYKETHDAWMYVFSTKSTPGDL